METEKASKNLCSFLGANTLLYPESALYMFMVLRKTQSQRMKHTQRSRAWWSSPVQCSLHPFYLLPLKSSR